MHPVINRIFKILKRTLIILVIVIVSVILAGTVFFMIYRDSIRQAVLHEVNSHLTAEVRAGAIRVSLLSHFPMLSLTMSDILISNPSDQYGDTGMLRADDLSLSFNIMDVLHGRYTLEAVQLSNARISLTVFEDGSDNYHFWKSTPSAEASAFSVEIRQVILRMVDISWQNLSSNESYSFRVINSKARGNFTEKSYELSVRGDFMAVLIQRNDVIYLRDREIDADVHLKVDGRTYQVMDGLVRSGPLSLHLAGRITAGEELETDLTLRTEEAPVAEYLTLLPPKYLSLTEDVAVDGNVAASAMIRGKWAGNRIPEVRVDFQVSRGSVRFSHPDIRLGKIVATGSYSMATQGKDEVRIERIRAALGEGWVEGSVRISDLSRPFVSISADAGLRLQDLGGFLPMDSLGEMTGTLTMKIAIKGPLRDIRQMTAGNLPGISIQGEASLNASQLLLKKYPLNCRDIVGNFHFDNQLLTVKNLSGTAGTSDFSLQGVILNFLPRVFSKDEALRADMTLTSSRMNLKEFLGGVGAGNQEYHFSLPENIRMNLDVTLGRFTCQDFSAEKLTARMVMRDRRLTLDDLSFTSMGGNIKADLDLTPLNDQSFHVKCNARLTHIDIQQLFHDFGNFDQKSLTDEHLRGWLDADVYFTSSLRPDMSIDANSIYTLGAVTVSSGELIGYTPLYRLSGILDIEDLKHIRFSELSNLIEIRRQTILIPEMEIKSNTLDLTLNGTHTFGNDVDYHISLLLSQLLTKRIRPDRQKEFGVVKDDGLGRSTLFIAVTGTADDPRFSYDRPALKEKLSDDLKKERRELKAALQEEFRIGGKDDAETVPITPREKGSFILEWDEGETDTIPAPQDQKKIRGPKFNLTWEEDDTIPGPGIN